MAPRQQRNKGRFGKGSKAGPGRPRLDAETYAIRTAARKELCAWFHHFAFMELNQAKQIKADELPLLAAGIYRSLLKFSRSGHWSGIEYLMNQVIGKPRESVELTGPDGGPIELIDWKAKLKRKIEGEAIAV